MPSGRFAGSVAARGERQQLDAPIAASDGEAAGGERDVGKVGLE